jgi:long-chain acyl-CoA synthetase
MSVVQQALRGRHLLVTGATGFVGKVWLSHLLAHVPEIGRVTLLVRSTRRRSARERLAEMIDTSPAFRPLKDQWADAWAERLDAVLDVVDGDVTQPMCGLSAETRARLAASVDLTLHIAGLTDFQPDPKAGVPANLEGTAHVADLVETFQHRRLLHVSTCFVAGEAQGLAPEQLTPGLSPLGRVIDLDGARRALLEIARRPGTPQDRIDAAMEIARGLGWPNLYTLTKGLAEHLLLQRPGLDVVITRPSVVECARSWPFAGWNEGLNTSAPIMWFCGTPFLQLPSVGHHKFDIVPVDAVARAMTLHAALHLEGRAERIWQVGTSDHNPTTFGRIIELTALGKRRHVRRPFATVFERAIAHLDVRPGPVEPPHPFHPGAAERLLARVRRALEGAPDRRGALGRLARAAPERVKSARREVTRQHRAMAQLQRMLEIYRPFIHDHDWTFVTEHLRRAQATLGPADAPFVDDLRSMCWRRYWLEVQYPGVTRWCFPIMDGLEIASDPPSDPPLALGRTAARLQGAA